MQRILAVLKAQLSGEVLGERTPAAALGFQAVVALLFCAVVRGEVGAYGYALVALSIPLALTTVPLLGELAPLLRADPAAEWVGAQPITRRELRLARVATALTIMGLLAVAALVPAALLAPGEVGPGARLGLVVAGVLQTWVVTAALLALQAALGRRGESLLVALQTVVFLTVLVGTLVGLGKLSTLEGLTGDEAALLLFPPAWFAAWLAPSGPGLAGAIAAGALGLAALVFALAPFPPAPEARSTRSLLSTLLLPTRWLAERVWVRDDERGPFAFVYEALPAEREFVVRTYPLVAAPLLFLVFGADASTVEGEGLWALLLFAPAAYLPFVLMHVPTTATPAARWVVDTSPVSAATEDRGALKAVAARLLLPLYVAIGALVASVASADLALRLWPVAVAVGLVTLRVLYRRGTARPLSTEANDLMSAWSEGLGGMLMAVAVAMTLLAVTAWRTIPSAAIGWSALGLCVAVELALHGRLTRSRHGAPSRARP